MPTGSDARQRRGRLAAEDGSASVEFLALSVILLVPLVYLMVFASQIQAAAFGAVAAADQAARVVVSADGGRPGPAEGAIRLTLGDYGVAADAYDASLACVTRLSERTRKQYGHEVRVSHGKSHGLAVGELTTFDNLPEPLPQGLVTVDSSARARMPRY